jgi:hypothetical protein
MHVLLVEANKVPSNRRMLAPRLLKDRVSRLAWQETESTAPLYVVRAFDYINKIDGSCIAKERTR